MNDARKAIAIDEAIQNLQFRCYAAMAMPTMKMEVAVQKPKLEEIDLAKLESAGMKIHAGPWFVTQTSLDEDDLDNRTVLSIGPYEDDGADAFLWSETFPGSPDQETDDIFDFIVAARNNWDLVLRTLRLARYSLMQCANAIYCIRNGCELSSDELDQIHKDAVSLSQAIKI